ncbi:MAG: hypothetical protein VB092_01695 [Oscillospiraceae bacterium]|nr:hypothetical protein [Oscillospiraceae bacterium]
MSALLLVLKILGWALVGLLTLLVLVCVAPVALTVRWEDGELTVFARVYGVRVDILPGLASREKKEKKPKEAPAEPAGAKKAKQKPDLETMRGYLAGGAHAAAYFLAHVRVKKIVVRLAPECGDPMATAFKTGRLWAEFGALAALAENTFKEVSFEDVAVTPVFSGEYAPREKYSCTFCALAGIIIGTAVAFLRRRAEFVPQTPENGKEKDNG